MYGRELFQLRVNVANPDVRQVNAWRLLCLLLALVLAAPCVMADEKESYNENAAQFPENVNRFFGTYCAKCHGPEESEGGVRLDAFSQDLIYGPHAEDWHEVLDALNKGEMPPQDEKQPSKAEREEVIEFLTGA